MIALTHARLVDGTGDVPLNNNATVVLDGPRIYAAGRDVHFPDDAVVIELRGLTVLPGLIDAHVHENHEGCPAL